MFSLFFSSFCIWVPSASISVSPNRPTPLVQDGLLSLFSSKDTGGDIVLEPATFADMCRVEHVEPRSLAVIYEEI